jgi:hypothetical protein
MSSFKNIVFARPGREQPDLGGDPLVRPIVWQVESLCPCVRTEPQQVSLKSDPEHSQSLSLGHLVESEQQLAGRRDVDGLEQRI